MAPNSSGYIERNFMTIPPCSVYNINIYALCVLCSVCQAIFSFLSLNADVQAFKSIPRTCVVSLPNPLALDMCASYKEY